LYLASTAVLIKKPEFKLLSERISKNVEPDSEDSDDDNQGCHR
jgi:hypothetical protein